MIWSLLFCVHPVHTEAVSGIVGNVFGPPILNSVDIFLLLLLFSISLPSPNV